MFGPEDLRLTMKSIVVPAIEYILRKQTKKKERVMDSFYFVLKLVFAFGFWAFFLHFLFLFALGGSIEKNQE